MTAPKQTKVNRSKINLCKLTNIFNFEYYLRINASIRENRNKLDKRLQCDYFDVGDCCLTPILMFVLMFI
jgi:hypothetical protein